MNGENSFNISDPSDGFHTRLERSVQLESLMLPFALCAGVLVILACILGVYLCCRRKGGPRDDARSEENIRNQSRVGEVSHQPPQTWSDCYITDWSATLDAEYRNKLRIGDAYYQPRPMLQPNTNKHYSNDYYMPNQSAAPAYVQRSVHNYDDYYNPTKSTASANGQRSANRNDDYYNLVCIPAPDYVRRPAYRDDNKTKSRVDKADYQPRQKLKQKRNRHNFNADCYMPSWATTSTYNYGENSGGCYGGGFSGGSGGFDSGGGTSGCGGFDSGGSGGGGSCGGDCGGGGGCD